MVLRLLLFTGLWITVVFNALAVPRVKKQEQHHSYAKKLTSKREIKMRKKDSTKIWPFKYNQLLHIEDHDFAMRPGFGGGPIPVGIDVQIESIDSISEVDMDFTMTFYLRHYWKDERLTFPSTRNKSMTFDGRLIQKIWVPDVFFVHSKRSFIHDTTVENIMLRVYPDGNVLFSLRITVSAMCFMDFSQFPLDSQNCSLELESYAYNEEDLMLYWKHGNKSLNTDEHISLSQFLIEEFSASSGLAFYSSTGWYNRLFINFVLRRHIFFFVLKSYFPAMLMVMLSWVSFWIDRRAVPARLSLGITTVLTMSTVITGASASMPQVSYIKAVDIYLWVSFLFVFLSVIEYAAVNYLTTVEERKQFKKRGKFILQMRKLRDLPRVTQLVYEARFEFMKKSLLDSKLSNSNSSLLQGSTIQLSINDIKILRYFSKDVVQLSCPYVIHISGIYNIEAVQAMAFDGCYHDSETDIDLTPFSIHSEEYSVNSKNPSIPTTDSAQLKRKKSLKGHVGRIILKNNHVIDTYSRIVFPAMFIVFNFFYWGFYV